MLYDRVSPGGELALADGVMGIVETTRGPFRRKARKGDKAWGRPVPKRVNPILTESRV